MKLHTFPAVFGQWFGTMAQGLSLCTEDRSSLRPANFNKAGGSNDSSPYQHGCNTLNHLITVAWATWDADWGESGGVCNMQAFTRMFASVLV